MSNPLKEAMSRKLTLLACCAALFVLTACGPSKAEELSKRPEATLLYPGAEVTQPLRILEPNMFDPGGPRVTFLFVTPDPLTEVLAFYSGALRAKGWSGPQTTPKSLDPTQYYWSKGNLTLSVTQLDEKTSAPEVTRPGAFLFSQTLSERAKSE